MNMEGGDKTDRLKIPEIFVTGRYCHKTANNKTKGE